MKTKSFFLTICTILAIVVLSGCDAWFDRSKDSLVIENPEYIKGIVADGPWDITIFQHETASAYIEYLDSYNVIAEVREDGYLHLKVKFKIQPVTWNKKNDFKAVIYIPNIELIKGSGACDITVNGAFHGEQCKIDLNGASDLKRFEYYGDKIEVDLDGASECSITGETGFAKISCSGASEAHMFDFYTEELDIKLSGASYTTITVQDKISGSVSGASTLKYRGNADRSNVKSSGASDIKKTS